MSTIIPAIPDTKELQKYIKPIYFIEDFMSSEDKYSAFEEQIYNAVKGCFEIKECREYPVKFKFYKNDKDMHELQLRHFLINVFMWHPFVNLYDTDFHMDETYILDCFHEIPHLENFINAKIIEVLRDYSVRNTVVNQSVSNVLHNLRSISINFSLIMGLTICTNTFLDWYTEDEELHSIMETRFPLDMQPSEIEDNLAKIQEREIDKIRSRKNDPVGVILRADTGIKHKQLVEFTAHMGLKPDLAGVTIPLPINSSTLIRGLDKPSSHYIDALGGRKSLIMNKKVMGRAGYFGKVVLLLARTLSLSMDVSDCGSKHYLKIMITSKKMLQKYNNRYYHDPVTDDIKCLNADHDTHLIGTYVDFRSPITCKCGDKVCHVCFGRTSLLNLDIADGVTGFEVEEVTKVVNQMILSTKHLLTTVSEKINFNDDFHKFFSLYCGEIVPLNGDDALPDIDDWAVWVDPTTIQKSDDLDEDSSFNSYVLGGFYVQNMKTGEVIQIKTDEDRELYLTDELIDLVKKGHGYAKFSEMTEFTTLFKIIIMNNELTKPLYSLMNLLNNSKSTANGSITYHEMAQKFTELLLDAGIKATALSGELIINRLVRRDPDLDYSRPDFSKEDIGKYKIVNILNAIEYNQSPLLGLAGQNLKRQILSDALVSTKCSSSYIDAYFKKHTSTENFIKKHHNKG